MNARSLLSRGPASVIGCCCVFMGLGLSLAMAGEPSPAPDLFHSTNLLHLLIEVPQEGIELLRGSQPRRATAVKPEAPATVRQGGLVYTNVMVQLKGFSSFRPVDSLPSLTLNFHKLAPQQRFHGLTKISLNNSLQDPTRLHEKLARELFAAAGVPVPPADYALVSLNGRNLGLYVLVQGYDKQFLKDYFKRTEGNLYDGGVLQDIDRPLQVTSGKDPNDHGGIERLLRAAQVPDPTRRFQALEATLDMDRFLAMIAMEAILCHSDSYSMNRNNYRLYHDPETDKIVFMPHGMDRVLGTHRSPLDLAIVPPALGVVARATLSTPDGRRRYLQRAGTLFTNLFQPQRLCQRIRQIDAKIAGSLATQPSERFSGRSSPQSHARDVEDLCDRIKTRAAALALQFKHPDELLAPAPAPAFDPTGSAPLESWIPKRQPAEPDAFQFETRDGLWILRWKTPAGPVSGTLRCRLSVPAGNYQLLGQIKPAPGHPPGTSIGAALVRSSSSRFQLETHRLDAQDIDFDFRVAETRAPEEIEVICEVRSASPVVHLDARSLRLVQR